MELTKVTPVVLCGGKGSRLWPLSTPERPKVFHRLIGPNSLFQDTLLRCQGEIFVERPVVVGSEFHRELICAQLAEIATEAELLLEPCGRNSLPAAIAGALLVEQRDPQSLIMLVAADHSIPDVSAFAKAVESAIDVARRGRVVVFGVKPDQPSEAFGYLLPGDTFRGTHVRDLLQFIEKPSHSVARNLLKQGWLWNSGNFLCRADVLLELVHKLEPAATSLVRLAFEARRSSVLCNSHFQALTPKSFDRAIMEKLSLGAVCPVHYKWRDLGSWDAIIALEAEGELMNSTSV